MKQQRGVIYHFLIYLLLSFLLLTVQAERLSPRGSHGALSQPCRRKNTPACNKGLVCNVESRCALPGSLKTACASDTSCNSGFCGALGHCSVPRKVGKPCSRDAQCISKTCSATYQRCVRANKALSSSQSSSSLTESAPQSSETSASSSTTTTMSSSSSFSSSFSFSSSPSPTPMQLSDASTADAALSKVQPVSDNAAFTSPGLLQNAGQISTFGNVEVVSTELGPAIEMFAEPGNPAILKQVLQIVLLRRQQSENTLSFNYNVAAFVTNDTAGGKCSIFPSINGIQLSPPITLTSASQSGTGFYRYSGAVSSYALALVCDSGSRARVQYDTVSITPSTSSTITSTTSSTSTAATSSASSSSATSASVTAAPTPSISCSGTENCGFETGWADEYNIGSGADAGCVLTDDPTKAHSGQYAQMCTLPNNKWAYVYIDGGRSRSYVVNSTYTLTFWVKFDEGANAAGMRCAVWSDFGDGPTAYNGICPLTNVAPQNGYYQVSVPFTAPVEQMDFYISLSKVPGTYYIDDISILDGVKEDVTYATATLSTSYTPTAAAPRPTGTQACVGIENCGLESGDLTSFTTIVRGHTRCAVTSSSTDVHDGLYAYRCIITDSFQNTEGGLIMRVPDANMTKGVTYDFSFWSKNNNASDINCSIGKGGFTYFRDVMPVVSTGGTNGYSKYSTRFTDDDFGAIGTIDCRFTNPATYFFDDFALTPVLA